MKIHADETGPGSVLVGMSENTDLKCPHCGGELNDDWCGQPACFCKWNGRQPTADEIADAAEEEEAEHNNSAARDAGHTRGPWEIGDVLSSGEITMMVGGGKGDVHITHWPCPIGPQERIANARLIAAAPELLSFAESVVIQADGDLSDSEFRAYMRRQALVAIARAEGRSL